MKPVVWLGDSLERVREFPPGELRVRAGGAYRVIYVAKFIEAVYVLHAFQKKSRKTSRTDIELAQRRFRLLVQDRRQQWPRN